MTTRAAVLAVIVCVLVLALTPPIRAYVGQRGDIRKLEQARAEAQRRVDASQRERARWDDPAYIEAQARERLRYVKPGEKSLVVTGPAPARSVAPSAATPRVAAPDDPWYERVWSTVEVAGTQPSKPKPARNGTTVTPAP